MDRHNRSETLAAVQNGRPRGRDGSPRGTSLAALLMELDPAMLAAATMPDPEAIARKVVIVDALERLPEVPGGVALLVGCTPADRRFGTTLRTAAANGYVAAVVKRRHREPPDVAPMADTRGIALLLAADDASWVAIEAAVAGALSTGGRAENQAGHRVPADLYDLADAIADRADAAITIEDVTGHVLAYSSGIDRPIDSDRINTILDRNVPDLPENELEYRQLTHARGPVVFRAHDQTLARVVMPVRADDRLIGHIWAIDATGNDSAAIGRELAVMSEQVALYLLADIRRSDLERQRQSELLAAELSADGAADPAAPVRRLPVALIGFGPLDPAGSNVVDEYRLTRLISRSARAVCPDALCARVGDVVFALLPAAQRSGAGRIDRLAASTIRMISGTLGVAVGCAFAGPIRTREDLPAARADIDLMLRYAARRADSTPRDVLLDRHLVVLQALSEAGMASEARMIPQVAALIENDRTHGSEFARTLLAHLDYFGDVRAAASALSIHENSHRYRMRKMVDQFGVDINDPQRRLVTWLQLRDAVGHR